MLDWIGAGPTAQNKPQQLYISGEWRDAQGGVSFENYNPTTGAVFSRVADAQSADIEAAIAAATAAQPAWAATPPAARVALFQKAADLFEERMQSFAEVVMAETGSGFGKTMFECANLTLVALRGAGALATHEIGEIYPSNIPGKVNRTLRSPRGVVGVISPWNFPLYLSVRGFIYAVALGNTVVLKPSEDSPVSGGLMLAELFQDAGFPPGVINVITTSRDGASAVGDAFVNDPRINAISFTGSTAVGKMLNVACAEVFKPIMLELGGKNPVIVLDDADVDRAVDLAFFSTYLHQGQICMSAGRILVARNLHAEFVEKLVAKTRNFVPTAPQEQTCVIGPVINSRQLGRIKTLVEGATAAGARLALGGEAEGPWFKATILDGVTPSMDIWHQEVFGPVASITPFDTEQEALAMANDTEYGLTASIVTGDLTRGEMLAEQVNAGMVHVNDSTVHDEPHCPFSGMGASGGGGKWGPKGAIEAFTTQRWITSQRVPYDLPF